MTKGMLSVKNILYSWEDYPVMSHKSEWKTEEKKNANYADQYSWACNERLTL